MESRLWGKRLSWPLQIVVWALSLYVAWNLVPMGYGKVFDYQMMSFFQDLGLPFWVFIASGIVEFAGPLLMFVPKVSFYAALPTAVVMAGASFYNGWSMETLLYTAIILVIAVLMRPGFLKKQPTVTTISI